jgi:membrane-associated phospholipid phosphatase
MEIVAARSPRPGIDRSGMYRAARRPVLTATVTVLVGVVLLLLGLALRTHPIDLGIVLSLNKLHTGIWALFSDAVYVMLGPIPAVLLTIVLAGLVWLISRSLITALSFGAVVALTWLPIAVLKVIVDRPRPEASALSHAFVPAQVDGSYPSGHTAFVVALAFAVWCLLRDTPWRWLALSFGAVATVVVGLAVVSDGLHYPTDVLASIVWALAMAPTARLVVVDGGVGWLRRRQNRLSA